jgi:hypothetical protein
MLVYKIYSNISEKWIFSFHSRRTVRDEIIEGVLVLINRLTTKSRQVKITAKPPA